MRQTLRLLANVKPVSTASRVYLEAGNPTGLTGLYTHPSPRSTLLYLYSTTLDKLKASVPEHSLYRQSVEALTKHRMALVEAATPPGYEAWAEKARKILENHPDKFTVLSGEADRSSRVVRVKRGDGEYLVRQLPAEKDLRYEEWDGEKDVGANREGSRPEADAELQAKEYQGQAASSEKAIQWEPEPQLTADQISELETKIGAGLIEEVVQVAEGELKLIDTMVQGKVWESLEEKPNEGQWVYFERKPGA